MRVSIDIPEPMAQLLGATPEDVGRHLLEQVALEGYRSGRLSRGQVRQMLGLSWQANEAFLAKHGCVRQYGTEELEQDRQNLAKIFGPA